MNYYVSNPTSPNRFVLFLVLIRFSALCTAPMHTRVTKKLKKIQTDNTAMTIRQFISLHRFLLLRQWCLTSTIPSSWIVKNTHR